MESVRRLLSAAKYPTSDVLIRLIVVTFSSRGQVAIKSRQRSDAATDAAEHDSDKFTARLKPSELMKRRHSLSQATRLQSDE